MGTRRTPEDRAAALAADRRRLQQLSGTRAIAPRVRHCWVRQGDRAVEGLLLDWTRAAAGWSARVALVGIAGEIEMIDVASDAVLPARRIDEQDNTGCVHFPE